MVRSAVPLLTLEDVSPLAVEPAPTQMPETDTRAADGGRRLGAMDYASSE